MKKYLYPISKKYLIITGFLLLMFSSCDDKALLKEVPLDFLAPENSFNNVEGILQGIGGLHNSVRENWCYSDEGGNEYAGYTVGHGTGTDVAYIGEDPNSSDYLANYLTNMTPQNSNLSVFWTVPFQEIKDANVLIQAINNSDPTIWKSEAQQKAYQAEAMFFRAFDYRILVNLFGDVPLIDYVVKTAKTDYVRAPKADIYKLMEDDLIYGCENLPKRGEEESPGRITQGAAWHMLSELYLTEGKYQLAVDAATHVINDYGYALMTQRFGYRPDIFGSGDVYFDLFSYGNQNLPENTESIWVIQVEPLIVGGGRLAGERGFGGAYFRMGNTPDGIKAFRGELVNGKYTGYSDTLSRPVSWMRPTNHVVYDIWRSDWNNDIRNARHSIKRNFYYDAPGSIYDKQKIDWSKYTPGTRDGLRDTNQYIFPMFMKFADPCHHFDDPARSGGGYNSKDFYLIRLAETILLRAEGYIRLNNLPAAAADINLIRSRANATPVLSADVNMDYLLDERIRELYGEEYRQITLRRTGTLLDRVRRFNNNPLNPGCNIQDNNVLYPIPQTQIDLNIDAPFPQNPGY